MTRRLSWWMGGILMSLLLLFTFSVFGADRPIGASTYVPYYAGILFGMDPKDYTYLQEIEKPGAWEGVMLLGVLVGGFITSIFITKTFRFTIVPTAWKVYKNNSVKSRLLWSFFSGFLLIIGARLAGGCTSGHFLSGMSQTAFSSMIFGGVVLVTLLVTGKFFYKSEKEKS
jgi:uncharacterized membrane protein YedE/YeeE